MSQHIAKFYNGQVVANFTVIVTAAVYWGFPSKLRLAADISS